MEKIKFKDLSGALQLAIILAWICFCMGIYKWLTFGFLF